MKKRGIALLILFIIIITPFVIGPLTDKEKLDLSEDLSKAGDLSQYSNALETLKQKYPSAQISEVRQGMTVNENGILSYNSNTIDLNTNIKVEFKDDKLFINGNEVKGAQNTKTEQGKTTIDKAEETSHKTADQTKVQTQNTEKTEISEDGGTKIGKAGSVNIDNPDFLASPGADISDASFTQIGMQGANNLEIDSSGNFKASSISQLDISRPNYQLYLDDTQHIRKKVLPVKNTTIENAKNIEYNNGILKAEVADSVNIDGTKTEKVFDLTITPAELDIKIPAEYFDVPAIKFERAAKLIVAEHEYTNLKNVIVVIQDNTILYFDATSITDGNTITFPNPIPLSPEEIEIIVNKEHNLLYLLKDTDIKTITTLKELVLKTLTQEEAKALYNDFIAKYGKEAAKATELDTVYYYLEDRYNTITMNLLPIQMQKISAIKKIFDGFYNSEEIQNKIYNILNNEERENLIKRYLITKNYELNLGKYSENEKKAFIYVFCQKAANFIDTIDSIEKGKITEIKSLLKEKTTTKEGKQINIATEQGTKTSFASDKKIIINTTTEGKGKLFVTEGMPPIYSFINQTIDFNTNSFKEEITKSETPSSAGIDEERGFECMVLAPNAEFMHNEGRKSFSILSEEFYSLCIKKEPSQIINEDMACENCGYVNFVNRSMVLNGLVSYKRDANGVMRVVYESENEKNNGIFVIDDNFDRISFLILHNAAKASFYYGNFRITEDNGKTAVSIADEPRPEVINGFIGSAIMQENEGALANSNAAITGPNTGFAEKLDRFIKRGGNFENLFK